MAIRVVSWNVLADAYVRREFYPNTSEGVLDRASRRKRVAERLQGFAKVDVLCLQEVDAALFALAEETLTDSIGKLFRKRGKGEGSAIFVRQAVTQEPRWKELVFSDKSSHVALGVSFADVTVVSTHLKWEPEGTPIDAHRGCGQLKEILETWSSGARIICGDFNATPDSEVITAAKAAGLLDAYSSLTEACTCNANNKKQRIDYILHTSEFTATPTALPAITDDTPLPSDTEPSDHIAIEALLARAGS